MLKVNQRTQIIEDLIKNQEGKINESNTFKNYTLLFSDSYIEINDCIMEGYNMKRVSIIDISNFLAPKTDYQSAFFKSIFFQYTGSISGLNKIQKVGYTRNNYSIKPSAYMFIKDKRFKKKEKKKFDNLLKSAHEQFFKK